MLLFILSCKVIKIIVSGSQSVVVKFLKLIILFFMLIMPASFAEEARMDFNITLPGFVRVESVTSPVLIANITDRTGNLYSSLSSQFKVISNSKDVKTLYLKANTVTDGGYEEAMFEQGGRVYIAFANIAKIPKSQSLANCKMGSASKDSPGVVAYPVVSIIGADSKFVRSKNKYEVYAPNGTTYVTVNVGSNVLKNSFDSNDPKGFYQAILSLTEADI